MEKYEQQFRPISEMNPNRQRSEILAGDHTRCWLDRNRKSPSQREIVRTVVCRVPDVRYFHSLSPVSAGHLGDLLKGHESPSKTIRFLWKACVQRALTPGLATYCL